MLEVCVVKRFAVEGGRGRGKHREFILDAEFSASAGTTILFGQSGSGKTTLLRLVAGIITPDKGRIALGGRIYFDSTQKINLPVQHRRVGFVFQDYALFPHMTAIENVAYGVRAAEGTDGRGMSKRNKLERARELLSLVRIEYAARQLPRELSGGESQRVALARALASNPVVMLLDEPLSAVDEATRANLIAEIKRVQQETGIPFLYVTHNAAEALALGSYAVVLGEGRIERHGKPSEVLGLGEARVIQLALKLNF